MMQEIKAKFRNIKLASKMMLVYMIMHVQLFTV